MCIFPATLRTLRELRDAGEIAPAPLTAFAVTPALREWYAAGDLEELEYAAMAEAARASLRLLDADLDRHPGARAAPGRGRRRRARPGRGAGTRAGPRGRTGRGGGAADRGSRPCTSTRPRREHDVRAAAQAVLAADLGSDDAQFVVDGAEGYELLWYATQELDDLLADP